MMDEMRDPADIPNWRRLDERLSSSGQPSETQLAALPAIGVTHVVNLGLYSHGKALPDEAASVAALGMTYIHLPIDFADPREGDYARFAALMGELAGDIVHVHCIANYRVSAFLYRLRRDAIGDAAARAEMESVWRPGGAWARIIGDAEDAPHQIAGRDY